MSANFLHRFGEENHELQKQIGCMTGIFQMFDRNNLLGGRRFKGTHNNKRITSENPFVNVSNPGADNVACSPQLVLKKKLSENQIMSMESSRTSFSSSTSSSFSSIDNKSSLQGPTSFNQATFQEKTLKKSPKSVNKEPQNLSVKTSHKEEFKRPVSSYIDSPRPMQQSKPVDGSYEIGGIEGKKSRSPLELNESIRVLMKLKEAPWTLGAKETSFNPRFSYDGREISTNFVDSRESGKPTSKPKELPRLSLDSRESSMKGSNSIMKDLDRSRSNKERNFTYSNGQKDFASKKSAPGVVAKLMGLEAMPTICSNHEEQIDGIRNYALMRPPLDSPRSSQKDLTKHCVKKNPEVISKPYFTAKTTIEAAPWKNTLKKQPETVYSEIEKRLKDLEFHHANKDLRALKQILDAIQAKGLLESKKNEQQHSPKVVSTKSDENLDSPIARKPLIRDSTKGISTKKSYDSPIVIMKPAKYLNRFDVAAHIHGLSKIQRLSSSVAMDKKEPCSSKVARDCSPRACPIVKGKTEENVQRSQLRTELGLSKSQQSLRENTEKSSNSVSPRLHQRKLEVESRIRSSSFLSSDSRKHQNLSANKQPTESVSPRNKLRGRPSTSQQGDEMSQRSYSNMSSTSQLYMEDTSTMNFTSPEKGAQKNPPFGLDEEASNLSLAAVTAEQPSPISVLDATFYQDDVPPIMVKRSTNISKGNKLPNSDNFCEPHKIDDINQKKLESIGKLLQKLEELNSTTEMASTTDHIASLCETQNPNHRYISEILLASGLLMTGLSSAPTGLMPIQLHSIGHPLNPDLFLVLEQTKSSQVPKSQNINENALLRRNIDVEKLQRKLVFDVVNEALVQKLELAFVLIPAKKIHGRLPSGQQLLKQLCSEIDQLHAEALKVEDPDDDESNIIDEEILRQPPLDWNDYRREFPCIVLDIERLIFKDMIDDVVCGEADSLKYKSSRRRRQLFAK